MSLVAQQNRLTHRVASIREGFHGRLAWMIASLSVALFAVSFQAYGEINPVDSWSYSNYKAPAHQRHRSAGNSSPRVSGVVAAVNPVFGNQDPWYSDVSDSEEMDASYRSEVGDEPEVQVDFGWRGYLQEKGPSRMMVEVEVEQELKPLSDEVWGLIMGTGSVEKDDAANSENESMTLSKISNTIPKEQVEVIKRKVDRIEEPVEMLKEEGDEDSPIIDDAAESYQQLMELFSRPVFATPAREFGDGDGMVSFRVPQGQAPATVRDGSQARFEIRR